MKRHILTGFLCLFCLAALAPQETQAREMAIATTLQNQISLELAQSILKRVAPKFGVSFQTLWAKYLDNQCTITQVDPKTHKVVYGSILDIDLDDTL